MTELYDASNANYTVVSPELYNIFALTSVTTCGPRFFGLPH